MGFIKSHNAVGGVGLPGHSLWPVFCCALFIAACTSNGAPSPQVLALLDNPPKDVKQKQDSLTPLTLKWYQEIETKFLAKGRSLTNDEVTMARKVGVANPERVRVIILEDFPQPANKALNRQVKEYGMGSSAESGRTMGSIVMLKARFKDERWMLAHQLSYIAQQEKMGRQAFVRRFIAERELLGNKRAPMELHANRVALDFK